MARPKLTDDQRSKSKTRILDAAKRLFDEGGIEAVRIRAVAKEVGIGPSTIYSYFASTNELLAGIWWDVVVALEAELQIAADRHGDPLDRVEALMRAFVSFAQSRESEFRITFLIAGIPEDNVAMIAPDPLDRPGFKLLYEAITDGVERGLIMAFDAELTAQSVLSSIYGAIAARRTMTGFGWRSEVEVVDEVIKRVLRGLIER